MKIRIFVSSLAFAGVAALFSFPASAQQPCLKKAWEAFNRSAYTEAVDAASDCIDQFSARAQRDEGALEADHEKEPLTGPAENAFDRKKIFERWAVNDVAAAFFIRGRSAEQLWKRHKKQQMMTMAKESYTAAQRLRYGRCWDPQGWFWSPAEAASDRLLALK